jgi:hypothetical protein
MMAADGRWIVRAMTREDALALADFRSAKSDAVWDVEVEDFVRRSCGHWAFEAAAQPDDRRALVLIDRQSDAIVGVVAHERATLVTAAGVEFDGSHLHVAALHTDWQGKTFPGGIGMAPDSRGVCSRRSLVSRFRHYELGSGRHRMLTRSARRARGARYRCRGWPVRPAT